MEEKKKPDKNQIAAILVSAYPEPGSRHEWVLKVAGTLRELGCSFEMAEAAMRIAADDAGDPNVKDRVLEFDSTYRIPEGEPIEGFSKLKSTRGHRKTAIALFELFGGTIKGFITSPSGKIEANKPENVRRALEKLGVSLSYDEFRTEKILNQNGRSKILDDSLISGLRIAVDDKFGFLPQRSNFFDFVDSIARDKTFNPVKEWFEALPTWDGVSRIDRWLIDAGGASDTELNQAYSRLPLMATVQRVYEPGKKFDLFVVLEGPQGCFKSTALKLLCPKPSWFSDDLPLGADSKVIIERTAGVLMLECAELFGNNRDSDRVKNFFSRQVDSSRLAYGREVTRRPRMFTIMGTTNKEAYLSDPTGNRRWAPVRVTKMDRDWIEKNKDQLWAEAYARREESIALPKKLWGLSADEQDRRHKVDPWEETILAAIMNGDGRPEKQYALTDGFRNHRVDKPGWKVTNDELYTIVGLADISKREPKAARRISDAMVRLGWHRVKQIRTGSGERVSGWRRFE